MSKDIEMIEYQSVPKKELVTYDSKDEWFDNINNLVRSPNRI